MTLAENELWDKAENYMIDLIEPTTIPQRLKVWTFFIDWDEDHAYLTLSIKQMSLLLDFLDSNQTLYKVLGMALAVGNIMNGGTAKGQSDGFDFPVIAKLNQTKDNSNKSLLNFIMRKLAEADPELGGKFKEDTKIWSTRSTDWDSLNKKFNDSNGSFASTKGSHRAITESGEAADNFSE